MTDSDVFVLAGADRGDVAERRPSMMGILYGIEAHSSTRKMRKRVIGLLRCGQSWLPLKFATTMARDPFLAKNYPLELTLDIGHKIVVKLAVSGQVPESKEENNMAGRGRTPNNSKGCPGYGGRCLGCLVVGCGIWSCEKS